MKVFTANALTVFRHPRMMIDYARWVGCTRLLGRSPTRGYGDGIRAGRFLHFTDYWSSRDGIEMKDQAIVRWCATQCGPDRIALDVGANIGLFSMLLAAAGFRRVLAFEPVPFNYDRLLANLTLSPAASGPVEPIRSAIGEQSGHIRFALNWQSPGTCKIAQAEDITPDQEIIDVEVTTLDEVCRQRNIQQIDFMKIDVEGFERSVLRGAAGLLRRQAIRYILMEVIHRAWKVAGYSAADIYDLLTSYGYVPLTSRADGSAGVVISHDQFVLNEAGGTRNVLWAHRCSGAAEADHRL